VIVIEIRPWKESNRTQVKTTEGHQVHFKQQA